MFPGKITSSNLSINANLFIDANIENSNQKRNLHFSKVMELTKNRLGESLLKDLLQLQQNPNFVNQLGAEFKDSVQFLLEDKTYDFFSQTQISANFQQALAIGYIKDNGVNAFDSEGQFNYQDFHKWIMPFNPVVANQLDQNCFEQIRISDNVVTFSDAKDVTRYELATFGLIADKDIQLSIAGRLRYGFGIRDNELLKTVARNLAKFTNPQAQNLIADCIHQGVFGDNPQVLKILAEKIDIFTDIHAQGKIGLALRSNKFGDSPEVVVALGAAIATLFTNLNADRVSLIYNAISGGVFKHNSEILKSIVIKIDSLFIDPYMQRNIARAIELGEFGTSPEVLAALAMKIDTFTDVDAKNSIVGAFIEGKFGNDLEVLQVVLSKIDTLISAPKEQLKLLEAVFANKFSDKPEVLTAIAERIGAFTHQLVRERLISNIEHGKFGNDPEVLKVVAENIDTLCSNPRFQHIISLSIRDGKFGNDPQVLAVINAKLFLFTDERAREVVESVVGTAINGYSIQLHKILSTANQEHQLSGNWECEDLDSFIEFLSRIGEIADIAQFEDKVIQRKAYEELASIIIHMDKDPQIMEQCFAIAAAGLGDCADAIHFSFLRMQLMATKLDHSNHSLKTLFANQQKLAAFEHVITRANERIEELERDGIDPDRLEIGLAYLKGCSQQLEVSIAKMKHFSLAHIQEGELDYVNQQLTEYLAESENIFKFMLSSSNEVEQRFKKEFAQIDDKYSAAMMTLSSNKNEEQAKQGLDLISNKVTNEKIQVIQAALDKEIQIEALLAKLKNLGEDGEKYSDIITAEMGRSLEVQQLETVIAQIAEGIRAHHQALLDTYPEIESLENDLTTLQQLENEIYNWDSHGYRVSFYNYQSENTFTEQQFHMESASIKATLMAGKQESANLSSLEGVVNKLTQLFNGA